MVNYTHGDLVEVVVLVIRIFTGEQRHDIINDLYLNKWENDVLILLLLVSCRLAINED